MKQIWEILLLILMTKYSSRRITLGLIADQILNNMPKQGYLTISNALQWKLQYARVVNLTDNIDGVTKVVDNLFANCEQSNSIKEHRSINRNSSRGHFNNDCFTI